MSDETVAGAASDTSSRRRDTSRSFASFPEAPAAAAHPAAADLPDVVGAAAELARRVRVARDAGYRVQMGFAVEALDSIVVSATAKALGEDVRSVPVTVPKQSETIVQGATPAP